MLSPSKSKCSSCVSLLWARQGNFSNTLQRTRLMSSCCAGVVFEPGAATPIDGARRRNLKLDWMCNSNSLCRRAAFIVQRHASPVFWDPVTRDRQKSASCTGRASKRRAPAASKSSLLWAKWATFAKHCLKDLATLWQVCYKSLPLKANWLKALIAEALHTEPPKGPPH